LYRGTPATGASTEATLGDEFNEELNVTVGPSTELSHRPQRSSRKKPRRDDVLSEPQLHLIGDDEVIDVEPVRKEFLSIQDKVNRLVQTLEHERREKAVLKKKYDQLCSAYYLQEQAQSAWKAAGLSQLTSPMSYGVVPQTVDLQKPSDIYQHTTSKGLVTPFPSFPPSSIYPPHLQHMQVSPSQSDTRSFPSQSACQTTPVRAPTTDVAPPRRVKTLDEFFLPCSRESKIAANSICSSASATAASLHVTLTEAGLKDENKLQADDSYSIEAKDNNDNGQSEDLQDDIEVVEHEE
jgi:hypothetical protein